MFASSNAVSSSSGWKEKMDEWKTPWRGNVLAILLSKREWGIATSTSRCSKWIAPPWNDPFWPPCQISRRITTRRKTYLEVSFTVSIIIHISGKKRRAPLIAHNQIVKTSTKFRIVWRASRAFGRLEIWRHIDASINLLYPRCSLIVKVECMV